MLLHEGAVGVLTSCVLPNREQSWGKTQALASMEHEVGGRVQDAACVCVREVEGAKDMGGVK